MVGGGGTEDRGVRKVKGKKLILPAGTLRGSIRRGLTRSIRDGASELELHLSAGDVHPSTTGSAWKGP
jgi:hypothetical protein